jgi:hypothetical protein
LLPAKLGLRHVAGYRWTPRTSKIQKMNRDSVPRDVVTDDSCRGYLGNFPSLQILTSRIRVAS